MLSGFPLSGAKDRLTVLTQYLQIRERIGVEICLVGRSLFVAPCYKGRLHERSALRAIARAALKHGGSEVNKKARCRYASEL